MSDEQLSDIESIRKLQEDLRTMKVLRAAMPFLRPILHILGADTGKIDEALCKVEEIQGLTEEMITLPDRFNDLLAARGWIMYDMLNFEVAKAAAEKAEAGDIDGAEADLTEYYSPDTVQWILRTMNGVRAFRPRMRLAKLALLDYREERYHACIPVVLALLDGLVNELHEQHRGFFAKEVDLTAWDSMAAHSKGLNALAEIFKRGRRKTRTEKITIPFRHGIMHGMDLGYDNKMVAAKTWAALFAIRDWALKVEKGELTSPLEEPPKSFWETLEQIRDLNEDKQRLAEWSPRAIRIGVDIPKTGEPDGYENDTPEQTLAEFIRYWRKCNYGYMAKCLPLDTGYSANELPAVIRNQYETKHLKAFEFIKINDNAAAITEIEALIAYEENSRDIEQSVTFRLVCKDSEGNPTVRGKPNSNWVIMNWNCI